MSSGGKREGTGRRSYYGEKTIDVTFKVPKSKKDEIKAKFYEVLELYRVNN